MDKTNIYLQFSDFTTGDCTYLYLGTIFGNPEDIYVCGQFVSGRITLDKKFPYDFIILKWDTIYQCPLPSKFPIGRNPKLEGCLTVAILTLELLPIIQIP